MFGFFDKPPQSKPRTFTAETFVDAPAEVVYGLVDPAGDRFMLLERGYSRLSGAGDHAPILFEDPASDSLVFEMTVEEAVPGRSITYRQHILSDQPIGLFDWGQTTYRIEPAEEGGCHVTAEEVIRFLPARSEERLRQEAAVYAIAIHNSIAKLKIHAEEGPERLREYEAAHLAALP